MKKRRSIYQSPKQSKVLGYTMKEEIYSYTGSMFGIRSGLQTNRLEKMLDGPCRFRSRRTYQPYRTIIQNEYSVVCIENSIYSLELSKRTNIENGFPIEKKYLRLTSFYTFYLVVVHKPTKHLQYTMHIYTLNIYNTCSLTTFVKRESPVL